MTTYEQIHSNLSANQRCNLLAQITDVLRISPPSCTSAAFYLAQLPEIVRQHKEKADVGERYMQAVEAMRQKHSHGCKCK